MEIAIAFAMADAPGIQPSPAPLRRLSEILGAIHPGRHVNCRRFQFIQTAWLTLLPLPRQTPAEALFPIAFYQLRWDLWTLTTAPRPALFHENGRTSWRARGRR